TSWTLRTAEPVYCSTNAEISADGSWLGAVGCTGAHLVLDTRLGAKGEAWNRSGMRSAADVPIGALQSPGSKSWLINDYDGQVELFDVHPLRLRKIVVKALSDDGMTGVAWSPDGRAFATAETNGAVRLWNADGTPRKTVQGPRGKRGEHRTWVSWGP